MRWKFIHLTVKTTVIKVCVRDVWVVHSVEMILTKGVAGVGVI